MIFSQVNDWLRDKSGGLPNWIITLALLLAAGWLIKVALLRSKSGKIDAIFQVL